MVDIGVRGADGGTYSPPPPIDESTELRNCSVGKLRNQDHIHYMTYTHSMYLVADTEDPLVTTGDLLIDEESWFDEP